MNKKQLYEYYVIHHSYSTVNGLREYSDSKLVIEPSTSLAGSERDLIFMVTRSIPEEYAKNPSDVEIVVRNF